MNNQEETVVQTPFSDATLERLLKAIDEAYGIELAWVTPTPDGSSIADYPEGLKQGAQEKLSDIVGFPINGDEFLYEIAARMEKTVRIPREREREEKQ